MRKRLGVAAVLLLAALLAAGPLLGLPEANWYGTHDGMNHPYLAMAMLQGMRQGIAYPRWLPMLNGGYGYPTFVFYQPGFFFAALPFVAAWALIPGLKLALYCMLAAGALGAYLLARLYCGRWSSACIGAVFILHPYITANLYVRGDYPEVFAILLCPASLYAALRAARSRALGWQLAAAGLAACIILVHPLVALMWLPLLALMWRAEGGGIASGLCVMLLGLTLAAPYWEGALQLRHVVPYAKALGGSYDPIHSLASVAEALSVAPYWLDPRRLGLFYHLAAAAGFACAWRKGRLWRVLALYCLAGLYLMSTLSLPVWTLAHPVLQFIQFSWRIRGPLAAAELLGIAQAALAFGRFQARWKWEGRGVALGLGIFFLSMASGPLRFSATAEALAKRVWPQAITWEMFKNTQRLQGVPYDWAMQEQERGGFMTLMVLDEFLPLTADRAHLPNRLKKPVPDAEMVGPGSVEFLPANSAWHLHLHAQAHEAAAVRINQFYFPGWRVLLNGRSVQPFVAANGRVGVSLPQAGDYTLEAWYDGPPGWQWRNAAMVLIMLAVYGAMRKLLARGAQSATTAPYAVSP